MALLKKKESLLDEFSREQARLLSARAAKQQEIRQHDEIPAFDKTEFRAATKATFTAKAEESKQLAEREIAEFGLKYRLFPAAVIDAKSGHAYSSAAQMEWVENFLCYRLMRTPGAFEAWVDDHFPPNGMNSKLHAEKARRLREELLAIERELEALFAEAEACGMFVTRPADMDPRVYLGFHSKESWIREKLEAQRDQLRGLSAKNQKLTDDRYQIVNERTSLENHRHLLERNGQRADAEKLDARIAALTKQAIELQKKIEANHLDVKREGMLFQNCITFLRDEGVKVDDKL